MGCAVLDSGCTSTVCGRIWLSTYIDSLSYNDTSKLSEKTSSKYFRFGDGRTYQSIKTVSIPIYTGSQKSLLTVEVVDCNIPLLLSNNSLKKANANLDFGSEEIRFLGENIPLNVSKSGHYYIKLHREPIFQSRSVMRIMFSSPIHPEKPDESRIAIIKLHKQFAHPHPNRLKKLIRDSGVHDQCIMDLVQEISERCDICKKFKKPLPRPVVAFPTATSFCQVVAMDLKDILGFSVLHMIDHATRYSSACTVPNKKKETIVKAILQHWVRLFGSPNYFLSDNGGEFINDEMIELAEQFNIFPKTTAAESAWSNGMCERHNEILADLVRKVQSENNCSFQVALNWALAAKNSLTNVYGFSPNQLVFGKNIELPSVHTDKLPAQNIPSSEYIMENLNALHSARQAFIKQESSEKLRRALNRKTRGYSDTNFVQGDSVYYYRNNSKKWHGPARVLGRDGQQLLLKHGGIYIRVHPCRIQLCNPDPSKSSSINKTENLNSTDQSSTTAHPEILQPDDLLPHEQSDDDTEEDYFREPEPEPPDEDSAVDLTDHLSNTNQDDTLTPPDTDENITKKSSLAL